MVREFRNKLFVYVLGLYRYLILINGFVFEWVLVFFDDRVFLRVVGVLFGVRIIENLYVLFCSWLLIWKVLMCKDNL